MLSIMAEASKKPKDFSLQEKQNCFRKGGFSKTNIETPASQESDLRTKIFDQAPDRMSKEEFENWLDIDNNAEVVAKITVSEICQSVADDKS
jgi:hypothetical protein